MTKQTRKQRKTEKERTFKKTDRVSCSHHVGEKK